VSRSKLRLALLLTALIAAGCGAEDAAENLDPVAEAADKTLATGGARITGTGTYASQGVTVEMVMDGEVDFEERAFAFEMDYGDIPQLSEKEVDEVRRDVGVPFRFVQKPDVVYATADLIEEDAGVEIEEEWIRIDVGELSEDALPGLSQLAGANESNPAEMLRFLKAAGGAKKVGEKRVRGVQTTEYRANVDLRKAADLVDEEERDEFRETIDRVAKAQGGYTFDARVFIDREGLIRRERITFDDKLEGKPAQGAFTLEFDDFGRDVSIEEPDGDDVRDVTDEIENALE
jgi:hypothetical protein